MKRRSDLSKLFSAARKVWRESETYQAVKKRCKSRSRPGWFTCESCKGDWEIIKIDHKIPVGKQPTSMEGFGSWLQRLFCPISNLQGLCSEEHKEKTKTENKERRARQKRLKRGLK